MTPTKKILAQIQEKEKEYSEMNTEMLIQRKEDNEKYRQALNAFAMANLNLNLCKTFLSKLIQSDLTCNQTKKVIKDFLETLNNK